MANCKFCGTPVMSERYYIRAEVIGTNASGQKHVRLLANNADGIRFWTDEKSLLTTECMNGEDVAKGRIYDPQYITSMIRNRLSCADQVGQLGEEAAELCHAALKLERALRGTNPTPVTRSEAIKKVLEETADVLNCLEVLRIYPDTESIGVIRAEKMSRWVERLQEREAGYETD